MRTEFQENTWSGKPEGRRPIGRPRKRWREGVDKALRRREQVSTKWKREENLNQEMTGDYL